MFRNFGKRLGSALAVLCLVSTLAMATEMACIQDDGKGTCTGATTADGTTLVVVGPDVKKGEPMDCMDAAGKIDCKPLKSSMKQPRQMTPRQ